MPTRPNHNTKLVTEKQEAREAWLKLVVKIISWKDGLIDGGTVSQTDKISSKEWNTYYNGTIRTNLTYGKQRVLNTLKETQELISKHNGFEK